jgi:hypothetical protein
VSNWRAGESASGHEQTPESRPSRARFAPDSGHIAAVQGMAGPGQKQSSIRQQKSRRGGQPAGTFALTPIHRRNDRHRDASSDQAIFDGRRTRIVTQKAAPIPPAYSPATARW